jgi:hypothetical protein
MITRAQRRHFIDTEGVELLTLSIGRRKAFPNAAAAGNAITEQTANDAAGERTRVASSGLDPDRHCGGAGGKRAMAGQWLHAATPPLVHNTLKLVPAQATLAWEHARIFRPASHINGPRPISSALSSGPSSPGIAKPNKSLGTISPCRATEFRISSPLPGALSQTYRFRYFCDCSIVVLPSDVAEKASQRLEPSHRWTSDCGVLLPTLT